ncbi:uncharacterized protein LOC119104870 [Pollicipes pollicipes]|uniref:uncharacterized protein LOC119104870 n=1 Tax=Pollicipes pollicipes TaxID=41117 RepID=UPI0018858ECC|nr:uncharacterized protein LOC119104870 [Pollicipes pollicipes]
MATMKIVSALLMLLLGAASASFPLYLQPFINYYEVYMEPYATVQLDDPQSYMATLAMVYLVVMGTLGYLPLNLKDVANVIDGKRSRKRRRFGVQRFGKRRGWAPPARYRGRRAVTDPVALKQLLFDLDPDNCVLLLICEAEYVGPREVASVEEKLINRLFSDTRSLRDLGAMSQAAHLGRTARHQGSQKSPCGQTSPQCRHGLPAPSRRERATAENSAPLAGHRRLLETLERAFAADDSRVERAALADDSRLQR